MSAPAVADFAPAAWPLPRDEVHVWHVPPSVAAVDLEPFIAPDERARAASMRAADRRRQYTAVRAALRYVLAGYLRTEPHAIAFCYGAHGKPALHPRHAGSGIVFSVSHARSRAVIAVARASSIGVDIERVVHGQRAVAVAERIFTAREAASLRALADLEVPYAFTVLWTRKEAYVKALGGGLTVPLASFEVSASAKAPAVVRCANSDLRRPEGWTLAEAGSVPDHVCTVAISHDADDMNRSTPPPDGIRVRERSVAARPSRRTHAGFSSVR